MIKLDGVETVGKTDKLKPCPFCGGKANFYVRLASAEGFAVEAWNRRFDNE